MIDLVHAILYTLVMALIIFCCRAFPWILQGFNNQISRVKDIVLRKNRNIDNQPWLSFVERLVPPTVMTILAFSSILDGLWPGSAFSSITAITTVLASLVTILLHVWKRNALLSILGGTGLYVLLLWTLG
ncbi:MAG: AzlD domain-containing protein [Treponema sp.]|jgi:branched-subunit amino acid transport protein AzlD|nr:AzlD domain-containing protein [Treponema sp.]